jgi:hypothetical protein
MGLRFGALVGSGWAGGDGEQVGRNRHSRQGGRSGAEGGSGESDCGGEWSVIFDYSVYG